MLTSYLFQVAHPNIQNYLIEHEYDDERALVLKQKEVDGIPSSLIASQLSGRRKAKAKLPTWHKTKAIVYPPSVNLEQCSSEATAAFKVSVVNQMISSKHTMVDLTGGLGVDAFFFSSAFEIIHYTEPNAELFEITKHNHLQLGVSNMMHHCLKAEAFIQKTKFAFDLVYIDPSRRDENARKVHKLADCTPDITTLQSELLQKSRFILLKASPLLDIQQGLREMQHVKKVFVVSVNNECKELLFLAEQGFDGEPAIEAVDLFENGCIRTSFSFHFAEEKKAEAIIGEPDYYLYEPNASVLKSGAFKLMAEKFGLNKLDVNTHLYTSSEIISLFPGKVFRIECLNPDTKQLKAWLPDDKVNIVSRNYPLTPDEIKKKLRLRDGGSMYLIGFSSSKKKHLALCSRLTDI
jgi:16S rRNA G966 N2-methylase RsmD